MVSPEMFWEKNHGHKNYFQLFKKSTNLQIDKCMGLWNFMDTFMGVWNICRQIYGGLKILSTSLWGLKNFGPTLWGREILSVFFENLSGWVPTIKKDQPLIKRKRVFVIQDNERKTTVVTASLAFIVAACLDLFEL